ncbi:MAG: AAA family ATPase [Patescibacteria group bacterium]
MESEKPLQPISLDELMRKEFPETKWIVEQLIPLEGIVALSGMPSAYKTWLILDLAIKVASGTILFDKFDTNKCGVLFIDEETGERWIQQRIVKLSNNFELPIYLLSKTGFKLNDKTVTTLVEFIRKHEIGVVIFDSLLRIHTASDENNAVEMAKVFSLFQKLTNAGVTVIFTHHNRKQGILRSSNPSQDMRGSSDILAAVDCHLAVDRKEESVVITQTKSRKSEELKPFKLNVIKENNTFHFEFAGEVDEEKNKKTDFQEAIKDLLGKEDKLHKKEIFEKLKAMGLEGGYTTFKAAIQELIDNGELFTKSGERNKVFCSIKPFEENQIVLNGDEN